MRGVAICLTLAHLLAEPAGAAQPDAGMRDSLGPHSLRSADQAGEALCGFCHVRAGSPGDMPQWRRSAAALAFQAYDIRYPDGSIGVLGSVSQACLSCHDGAMATDALAIAPATAAVSGSAMPATGDHPVGVPFPEFDGLAAGRPGPPRLHRDTEGGEPRWWIDLEAVPNGRRDRTDAILYTRGTGAAARPFIECATCHDPHGAPENKFLRPTDTGANLCRACHSL